MVRINILSMCQPDALVSLSVGRIALACSLLVVFECPHQQARCYISCWNYFFHSLSCVLWYVKAHDMSKHMYTGEEVHYVTVETNGVLCEQTCSETSQTAPWTVRTCQKSELPASFWPEILSSMKKHYIWIKWVQKDKIWVFDSPVKCRGVHNSKVVLYTG